MKFQVEALVFLPVFALACGGPGAITPDETSSSDGIQAATETSGPEPEDDGATTYPPTICEFGCDPGPLEPSREIDLLIIVDNRASMADEQAKLVAAIEPLVAGFHLLESDQGTPLSPSVNIMVTSTDMGHPLCDPIPGYEPKQGAPQQLPCIDRLDDFTSAGPDPLAVPELCEAACPRIPSCTSPGKGATRPTCPATRS